MSTSLPSKPIFVADVPEVQNFPVPEFVYNFFTPDETSNETGTTLEFVEKRSVSYFTEVTSASKVSKRLPRYVQLRFRPAIHEQDPNYAQRQPNDTGYITNNLNKIISEDQFAAKGHIGVNFEPVSFRDKIYGLVSGSSNAYSGEKTSLALPSSKVAAIKVNAGTTGDTPPAFLLNAMNRPNREGHFSTGDDSITADPLSLRTVFDTRIAASAVATSLYDPLSTFNEELQTMWEFLKPIESKARSVSDYRVLSHKEFDPEVQFTSIQYGDDAVNANPSATRVVGYVIDKWEMLPNGGSRAITPSIVIENPKASSYLDHEIKYGTWYAYSIRTIAEAKFAMPVELSDGSTEMALVTVLVSSRPTVKRFVRTIEVVPPPAPVDVDFVWNYEDRRMTMYWAFPTNPQRDIKKFQIFRRRTIDEPFELIHLIDFNDSEHVYPDPENDRVSDSRLDKREQNSPVMFFEDEEFNRDSSFVYAVASSDAHGMSSGYSQQFRVSFDRFKNKLAKVLVSAGGAPKVYPNYFLLRDTFVDVMTGSRASAIHLYFNPDGYSVNMRTGEKLPMIETNETSGYYQLSVMNTDVQKLRTVKIDITRVKTNNASKNELDKFLGEIAAGLRTREK